MSRNIETPPSLFASSAHQRSRLARSNDIHPSDFRYDFRRRIVADMTAELSLRTDKLRLSATNRAILGRCFLLELPAEIRELIWTHTVTEWTGTTSIQTDQHKLLEKQPIRIDKFNRPLPPPISLTCSQVRNETLPLYYQQNIFEAWQPLYWLDDWTNSALVDWLTTIGPERIRWLREVVLLYKQEDELQCDIESELRQEGFEIAGIVHRRQALSELEMYCENLGLPTQFVARKGGWRR